MSIAERVRQVCQEKPEITDELVQEIVDGIKAAAQKSIMDGWKPPTPGPQWSGSTLNPNDALDAFAALQDWDQLLWRCHPFIAITMVALVTNQTEEKVLEIRDKSKRP